MENLTHATQVSDRTTTPAKNDFESLQGKISRPGARRFRLMVVHDRNQNLYDEIDDLKSIGIPANTEVLLLTVTDLFRAPMDLAPEQLSDHSYDADRRTNGHDGPSHRPESFKILEQAAQRARTELLAAFPLWEVRSSISMRPDQAVLNHALRWQPDLLAIAPATQSIARSRAFRGIMRKLVTELRISLRVLRSQRQIWTLRRPTIVAIDGPESAQAIMAAMARGRMARGRDIRLLFCADPPSNTEARLARSEWVAALLLSASAAMETSGHRVKALVQINNTAQAILDEAKLVDAESILIGKGNRDILSDLIAQSVAATVAANASCPVEIVCALPDQNAVAARQTLAA